MKVLVTGGTGVLGRAVAGELARRGALPVAMARHAPTTLPAGVHFERGDVSDARSVRDAMRGCDAVVHLAWFMHAGAAAEVHAVNVGGVRNVLEAMEATGASRLVFSSSVTAYGSDAHHPQPYREDEPLRPDPAFLYGWHKRECEALIAAAGVDAVIARVATTLGRGVENTVTSAFAGPVLVGIAGDRNLWQFVHQEDVGRFVVAAALGARRGIVNLAAEGVLELEEVAALLERRLARLPERAVRAMVAAMYRLRLAEVDPEAFDALRYMPVADTTRLREEWGFRCAWTSQEAVEDEARSLSRVVYLGSRRFPRRHRLVWADTDARPDATPLDGRPLVAAAPPGLAGELDDRIDPRYPTFTATNLSEAFPGPMTPLSLTISVDALRAGIGPLVDVLGMRGDVAHESRVRMVAVFGHRIFLNVSAARESAKGMPGNTPEDVDKQYLGIPLGDGPRPKPTVGEVLRGVAMLARIGPPLAGLDRHVARYEREARRLASTPASVLAAMPDEMLAARIGLLRDELAQGWLGVQVADVQAGAALGAVERVGGEPAAAAVRAGVERLEAAQALRGVEELTARARSVPEVAAVLRSRPASEARAAIASIAPEFVERLDRLVAEYGHRGPGETELENPTFSDRPELLVEAVAKCLDLPERSAPPTPVADRRVRVLARAAARTQLVRERVRDATIRVTHALRLAVREWGARLAARGAIEADSDVYYLIAAELLIPPTDARERVARRRAERARLAAIRMPAVFTGTWAPEPIRADALEVGDELTGIAAAPGVARGRARILEVGEALEPGEVLVARVTDTGWTPFFGFAAAVVTDIGGLMSHPAVVAREFGIPSVVGTRDATMRLRDGQLVEVDGDAGVVRVLERPASAVDHA
jgi:nucleoside-diphosphate-sugar epimerase/phosphohistidine swiveling domain-containing protein